MENNMNWFAIKIMREVNDFEALLREMAVVSQISCETLHPLHKETPHKAVLPEASAEVSQSVFLPLPQLI